MNTHQPIIRTIKINDLNPHELAELFADMDDVDQAKFFNRIWEIASEGPGAGWCKQSSGIARNLDRGGRACIAKLAEWAADPEGLNI